MGPLSDRLKIDLRHGRAGVDVKLYLGPHMRRYILDEKDSMNVVLDDIRELFKPHFDDAEIDFLGRYHPDATSNWSNYATLRSYSIKLGVKKPDTRGPE